MRDFDRLWVWQDPALAGSLTWYRAVALNRRPAKFRIAATIPTGLALRESSETALWDELSRLTPIFRARWQRLRDEGGRLGPRCPGASLLDLCNELAQRMLAHCNFCRWHCEVDRTAGTKFGACKLAADARVSSYFHHTGEELVYRGTEGSGTIFFS